VIVDELNGNPLVQYQQGYLLPRYEAFPHGRYVSLVVIRKTEGEAIFRTEGSGEGLTKETTIAGLADEGPMVRVMISKRKQTAVERRTGRELLREHDMLRAAKGTNVPCALNTNNPCERCIDCLLYGFAVGGGGAQKSRVLTDDAFSLPPASVVTNRHTFNATFDNSTMRNPLTGEASHSIGEDEYVRPETHFLDIETLKDVTLGELSYVIGNVLRSERYGAISSRIGKMRNTIAAIIFSDCELFSNLELTQAVYDRVKDGQVQPPFPVPAPRVRAAVEESIDLLLPRAMSREPQVLRGEELDQALTGLREIYRSRERVQAVLTQIQSGYPDHP